MCIRDRSYTVPSTIPATTLQISTYTTNSITLNWNQSADDNVVGYTLYYGPASGTYTNAIYLDGATTVNATVNNLSSDANYYFMVKCKDNNGNESLPSNEATVTDGVAMQNTAFWLYYTNATWQSVTLAWNPPADTNVAYYELFYDTVSGGRYLSLIHISRLAPPVHKASRNVDSRRSGRLSDH